MLPDRFWSRVEKTETCWLWTGAAKENGYGVAMVRGKIERVHRLFYLDAKGPIPKGFQLDHLCRVHNCVNPDHLEVVDSRTNTLRGVSVPAQNARKTHCIRGHELAGANLRITRRGRRECLTCSVQSERDRRPGGRRPRRSS